MRKRVIVIVDKDAGRLAEAKRLESRKSDKSRMTGETKKSDKSRMTGESRKSGNNVIIDNLRTINRKQMIVKCIIYIVVIASIVAMWVLIKTENTFYALTNSTSSFISAKVIAIESEEMTDSSVDSNRQIGTQQLLVEMENGERIAVTNYITDIHHIIVKKGSAIILCADQPEGVEPYYTVYNYNRSIQLLGLLVFFLTTMLIVGGKKGMDAVLAIGFTLSFILKIMLPAIYNGASPVIFSFLCVILATVIAMLLFYGWTQRGLLAGVVTLAGEVLACLFFFAASAILHISGFNLDSAESLLVVAQNTGLQLKDLLFAVTMIAALGAVMDVAVSLLSALWELKITKPEIQKMELFRAGMHIGKDMIGTMSNTLIFAFAGSAFATMLVFYSYGVSITQILHSDYLAMEIAQGICSTMAVIMTVPLASLTGAVFYKTTMLQATDYKK